MTLNATDRSYKDIAGRALGLDASEFYIALVERGVLPPDALRLTEEYIRSRVWSDRSRRKT